MADLKTDYKDDILDTSQNTRRKYQMINNQDGTVSFVDVTEYIQQGDSFGADDVNAITDAINKNDGVPVGAVVTFDGSQLPSGFEPYTTAEQTAITEINNKLNEEIVYTGSGDIVDGSYITLSKNVSNCRYLEIHCSASPHSSVTPVPVNIILPPSAGDSCVSVITRSQDKSTIYTHFGVVGLDSTDGTKLKFSMGYRIGTNVSSGASSFYENSSQIRVSKVIAVG